MTEIAPKPRGKMTKPIHNKKLRAIDLYSGVGGWSLGLRMAGIEVVASYEWWGRANLTNQMNNRHPTTEIDIRTLGLESLPTDIDIVVGSPPCTQFSFANRGGNGDIEDGLKDIAKFLDVVDFLRPKYWAMENVPRVAGITAREMLPGGRLAKYSHLNPTIEIADLHEWGVPQRRKRCIIGNFSFDLLRSYRTATPRKTLGDVVRALSGPVVLDPIYRIEVPSDILFDHVVEPALSDEEARMNREMKTFHPVYNNMPFPDPLDRPARTVTATCTRVSRESVVISLDKQEKFLRRLTVRERASVQGFPITYQFFGETYAQKLKMIGNAVPPLFTFYIAQAMLETPVTSLRSADECIRDLNFSSTLPTNTRPDIVGESYPVTRRFRAAIPNLRFKSGVRFELANSIEDNEAHWLVRFFFGNSKEIGELELDDEILSELLGDRTLKFLRGGIREALASVFTILSRTGAPELQAVWSHVRPSGIHPYEVVDALGASARSIIDLVEDRPFDTMQLVEAVFAARGSPTGTSKIVKHSESVLAGIIVGASANAILRSRAFNHSKGQHRRQVAN